MRLVILGGPGAGKGTQAQRIATVMGVDCISPGEILRAAISSGNHLGEQVQSFVEAGELVPDPLMIQLIREWLVRLPLKTGWLLEGYPRTAFQAEELDFLLEDLNQPLDAAILLEAPDTVLMSRSLARGRVDDTEAAISRRIQQFRECTTPLIDYYQFRDRLLLIDSDQPLDHVEQQILEGLNFVKQK